MLVVAVCHQLQKEEVCGTTKKSTRTEVAQIVFSIEAYWLWKKCTTGGQNNTNERKDSTLQGKDGIVQNAARRVAERKKLAIYKVDDDDESMEGELTEITEPKKDEGHQSIFVRSMKAVENSVSALESMYDSTYRY
jgi:hypothetical protein